MRAALGAEHNKTENLLYSLESDIFSWKRLLSSGLIVKLGQVKVKKVPAVDTYESILDKSLEDLIRLQEQAIKLKDENNSLREDRDSAIAKVTEFASLKEEWEKKLYGRFVAVLNAKKEKIQELEEELDQALALRDEELMAEDEQEGAAAVSSKKKKEERRRKDEDPDDYPDEDEDEDPFGGDTDVDSEDDGGAGVGRAASLPSTSSTPSMSMTLRRTRDMFDSFDSPGSPSPAPVLPKRARMPPKASASASTSASTLGSLGRNVFKHAVEQAPDEDDDMKPLTLDADTDFDHGENTQDLLDEM